jgi:Neuraminidase (sialidase)
VKYPGTVTGGVPNTNTTNLDNDLAVNVVAAGPVNEASPYAFFTVTGTAGENLILTLGNTAVTTDKDATIGGFAMEYSTDGGATWQLYSKPPIIPGSGTVLVRVNIASESDTVFEGPETFTLTGRIATGAGATSQ